jgi:hypothetical protein
MTEKEECALLKIAKDLPDVIITVKAGDLLKFAEYCINKTIKEFEQRIMDANTETYCSPEKTAKIFKVDKSIPERISGCRAAVKFLNEAGYRISLSLMQKETANGNVPCQRFHHKYLVFKGDELLNWAEKNCESVSDMSTGTLAMAASANDKLRQAIKEKGELRL